MKPLMCTVGILTVAAGGVAADVIHFTHGGKVEGEVLQRDDARKLLWVEMRWGKTSFPLDLVARVQVRKTSYELFLDRYAAWKAAAARERGKAPVAAAKLSAAAIDSLFQLGRWARARGLVRDARRVFGEVIRHAPGHERARQILGYAWVKGKWRTFSDAMKAQGKVKYDGRWMDAAKAQELHETRRHRRRMAQLQLVVNRLVRLMGHPSEKIRAWAYNQLVDLGRRNAIKGLDAAADRVRDYYARRRQGLGPHVIANVRGSDGTLVRPIRQASTGLGVGVNVNIQLPELKYKGVRTTVAVPSGER